MKVYDMLPPPKDTLNDVIAVIFTGVEPASTEDLKRTPVLVRRAKIKMALEWLILNHKDYVSLKIDYDELAKYDEEGIPVTVIHKQMDVSEGNVLATAKSVFDNDDEIGAEEGPCPYTVHGLSSEKFSTMTSTQRKGAALQHLAKGGHFLAVGHDPKPQSMYNNPSLYPLMFPWLFPYGLGAVGQDKHTSMISYETHLRWLLLYHDKRFQMDPNFVIVTFNHQLIRQSTTGSFMMMKRSNFDRFVLSMKDLHTETLYNIATRMRNGEYVVPKTAEEKRCFSILDHVEYVGSNVSGGVSEKKFQRAELWSLLSFMNAPNWFITITPVDNKHPLCLYLAGSDDVFKPEIKGGGERLRIISQNPVACARFFDYMVQLFIQHICGWSDDDSKRRGLFGRPAAYYGTVEQQGRLTLHLHFLLWIEGSPSPQGIRDRLLDDDAFQQKLIEYLESCQTGEFLTGSMEDVEERYITKDVKSKKLAHREDETDPTLTMPTAPPDSSCTDVENCICDDCSRVLSWCFAKKKTRSQDKATETPAVKVHPTGKGCLTENGHCTARFPRETFEVTKVHPKTGHVSLKKKESMMNSITPAITFTTCGNTDTTCLLSGTSVKATIGYVTDYVTKAAVKTHQVISAMYDVWTNPNNASAEDVKDRDHVRKLVLKVVNSLTSKLELGAPFAAFRMLGYPERYTSHEFTLFYWKSYCNYVDAQHDLQSTIIDPIDNDDDEYMDAASTVTEDVGLTRINNDESSPGSSNSAKPGDENVQVFSTANRIYNKSSTEDYRLRPHQLEAVNVYEWVQCSIKHKISDIERARKDLQFFKFHVDHPQYDTHVVACDPARRVYMVPNFRGPPLPRRDEGDYDEYCSTMLTLFKPWRTGVDLKPAVMGWPEAFENHEFTKRQVQLMDNFNVRYECYDAKDDFYAMNKHRMGEGDKSEDIDDENEEKCGYLSEKTRLANEKTKRVLDAVHWLEEGPTGSSAALIGGQTYHSFLSIGVQEPDNLVTGIEELRERLMGVSYLIIDEVSMIGCLDLLRISRRCQEALQSEQDVFGGLNIVLAGDFAQLPPTHGFSLYTRDLGGCQPDDKLYLDYLGKSTWLQFTTAVILKKNMRQSEMTDEDEKFRTCLQNMRMKACTPDDINFLRSIIAEFNPETLAEVNLKEFRFSPIITSLNADKDYFNDVLSDLFAKENGQQLTSFYSVDRLAPTRAERRAKAKKVFVSNRRLDADDQMKLWNQAPHTSKQVAGKLRLCIGMPVIIRYNVATELCITRGQEATVVAWTSSSIPAFRDLRALDTLYVKLKNPPKTVRIPGLPDNVVPLGRNVNTVDARLPSDKFIRIARSQIPILPAFSITDFGAQGKGMERCRADLSESRNHQAMYVSLSRATSAKGVLILRDFPVAKITGGLDGSLRQEFRELNYLDEITRLQYEGELPSDIIDVTRHLTISNYRKWRGNTLEKSWHPALQGDDEDPLPPNPAHTGQLVHTTDNRVLSDNIAKEPLHQISEGSQLSNGTRKRKRVDTHSVPMKKTRSLQKLPDILVLENDNSDVSSSPNDNVVGKICGPLWDPVDHSCAFDSWTFILYTLWLTSPSSWDQLHLQSPLLNLILVNLKHLNVSFPDNGINRLRNTWRQSARQSNPTDYMATDRLVDIIGLTMHLLGFSIPPIRSVCTECASSAIPRGISTLCIGPFMTLLNMASIQAYVDLAHKKIIHCADITINSIVNIPVVPYYQINRYSSTTALRDQTLVMTAY
ncbi:hypothetical protein CVT24_012551 [Panaeolus cyanescens]|uniref:ATP-dependent DNA helicase n=1 Tax=Panaeolus cyanescens TaxID=181874 RepID=A0A409W608_9AGAR|nr:hypothetical protein CVT24_012551 [Panaeolus cyanescens]